MAKKKYARAGGKFTASHSTVIPAAGEIADIADSCAYVTKISLGFIKAGLPGAKGMKRLKIQESETSMMCTIRDNTSLQELRIYVTDIQKALKIIREGALKKGFILT